MSEAIQQTNAVSEEAITKLLQMDVNMLTVPQRNQYLYFLAKRSGLDPALKPFDLIPSKDKTRLILYANAGCADQLREINNIQSEVVYEGAPKLDENTILPGVYMVKVKVWTETTGEHGRYRVREYTDVGCASIDGLKGDALSEAIMKAHTRAERRTTLGFKGFGMPDISELDNIIETGPKKVNPNVKPKLNNVTVSGEIVDSTTGEILTPADPTLPAAKPVTKPNGGVYKKVPPAVPPVSF